MYLKIDPLNPNPIAPLYFPMRLKKQKKESDVISGKYCGCGGRRSNRYLFVNLKKQYKCTKCGRLHEAITDNSEIEKYL